jgi:phosphotransferase system  glucose/maltose/N-acetylglucosamine-specific IIC component
MGVLAGANVPSFFVGTIAYSSSLTFLGVVVLAALVGTLVTIHRNLTSTNEPDDSWPPIRQVHEKRPSFTQKDMML